MRQDDSGRPGASPSHGGEASEAGNVGEIGSVKPGQQKKLTLTLKKGHYSLLCNLPGHYAERAVRRLLRPVVSRRRDRGAGR